MNTSKMTQGLILEDRLDGMLESDLFDEREASLVRLRYGIGIDKPLPPSEIAKVLKIKAKALEIMIDHVDRKIFNFLKNEI